MLHIQLQKESSLLILPLEHPVATALVKARVEGVEVLRVKVVLGDAKSVVEITLSNGWEFCLMGKGKL